MRIIAKVGAALQELFGNTAAEVARKHGLIVRERKFTARSLTQTFVLGYLQNPQASAEELAQLSGQCGTAVTAQAVDQRQTPKLVKFLQELFCRAVRIVVGSDRSLAPLLERFTSVTVLDSSTITLPDELQKEFAGCGGSYGGGVSAMKLQTELDLRSGALTHVEIEQGRSPDGATSRQQASRGRGSLRITDLGYFNIAVFAAMTQLGEYFLSRLQWNTKVLLPGRGAMDVLKWLSEQAQPFIDQPILLGQEQRLACRLIAWRLPEEQAKRQRQRLRRVYRKKDGTEPSKQRLAWCNWTILVSNVPVALMSAQEAAILYRARWQVELLFKRWKTQDRAADLRGSTLVRQMVGVWSRLLAALVQHWLLIATVWGDPSKSLSKAAEAVRKFVSRLAVSMTKATALDKVLDDLNAVLTKTCRRNKRSKPGTFELLNNVELLDYVLT